MAKMGRPKIEIDKKRFEILCAMQATEEVCSVLGGEKGKIDTKTLNRWCRETYKDEKGRGLTFSQVFRQKRLEGKASLRRMQWTLARRSAAMAIFLGKNYLGQSDNPNMAESGDGDVPVFIGESEIRE
jgi:hypothetical protein|nr:MAG TPA: hypothetical protein [Caudoviricetes sp.]